MTQTRAERAEVQKEYYQRNRSKIMAYAKKYQNLHGIGGNGFMLEVAGLDGLISESELLEVLGISIFNLKTLWRKGLPSVTVGRNRRLYLVSDLIETIKRNRESDTVGETDAVTETDAEPNETPEE